MKILNQTEYNPKSGVLKTIEYNKSDFNELKKRFNYNPLVLIALCKYLDMTNSVLIVSDTYDGQSGWRGQKFVIGDIDLSINGFCLSEKRVKEFLNSNR